MNNTKEKQAKLQIIISVLVFTAIIFAEIYVMIHYNKSYISIIGLLIAALASVYICLNAMLTLHELKETQRNEHFENLYKSEKASYLMLKKSFEELREQLEELQEGANIPSEEIINAQKGIAKVIIARSKENADAVINSNIQMMEKLDEIEESNNANFDSFSKEQKSDLADIGVQTEMKIQDMIVHLKDAELRLNQSIINGTKVVMQTPAAYDPVEKESVKTEVETSTPSPAETISESDFDLTEEVKDEVKETIEPEEEKPEMPDLSDPNKMMSPDDIAALLANMNVDKEPMAEEIKEEPEDEVKETIEPEEEKPEMPDLSDPNKVMSPDEIAALIANL